MAETLIGLQKSRKPNFTEGETLFILGEVKKHKEVLTAKSTDSVTNERKKDVWQKICDGINVRNIHVQRSVDEIRRRWKNMMCTARKEAGRIKRIPTGSGPVPAPSDVSMQILELIPEWQDIANINGIDSGIAPFMKVEIDLDDDEDECEQNVQYFLPASPKQHISDSCSPEVYSNSTSFVTSVSREQPGLAISSVTSALNGPVTPFSMSPHTPATSVQSMKSITSQQSHDQNIQESAKKRKMEESAAQLHQEMMNLDRENLTLEKEKIKIEKEKIAMEKEQMTIERQKLNMEREKLAMEKEKMCMEKEKLSLEINYWKRKLLQITYNPYEDSGTIDH